MYKVLAFKFKRHLLKESIEEGRTRGQISSRFVLFFPLYYAFIAK